MLEMINCGTFLVVEDILSSYDLTLTTYCTAITRLNLRQCAATLLYFLLFMLNSCLSCTLNFFDLVCFRWVPECTWSWLLLRSNWGVFTTGWLV